MKKIIGSFVRRLLGEQHGQALVWTAAGITAILGIGGLLIDVGRAYVVRADLQNYANAAALAAAGNVYNSSSTSNATYYAGLYSAGATTDENYNSGLGVVTPTVTPICLNMLMTGTTCSASGNVSNAVKVTETATINTMLMRVMGFKTITVTATAIASMQGKAQPWNVAVVVDTTGSMSNTDANCGSISRLQCALDGVQTMLAATNPSCPASTNNCPSDGKNFHVALFTFPNIITSDLGFANACSGATFTTPAPYQVLTLPKAGLSSYTPLSYTENGTTWSASYEVTYGASDADANGFVGDYYSPTSIGGLNSSSSLVQAIGYGGTGTGNKVGCLTASPGGIALNGNTGTGNSGTLVNKADVGEGITYYAPAIYAAQAALTAEQTAMATAGVTTQNAIIFLGDGEANTQWIYFPQGTVQTVSGTANTSEPSVITNTALGYSLANSTPNTSAVGAYYLATPNLEATGTISGLYPDFFDECQQAIVAAQYAAGQGTRFYSVAYGSEATGCSSYTGAKSDDYNDVTFVLTTAQKNLLNSSFSTVSGVTPCVTMENMASAMSYFYSDYNQSGSGSTCQDNSHSVSSLGAIFNAIAASFQQPRLLPNNAT